MIRRPTPAQFRAELAARPALPPAALATAAEIIAAVRERGDAALLDCIERYEHRSICHPRDLWIEREYLGIGAD